MATGISLLESMEVSKLSGVQFIEGETAEGVVMSLLVFPTPAHIAAVTSVQGHLKLLNMHSIKRDLIFQTTYWINSFKLALLSS
ncbi:hypothetical protein CEXT_407151 [Caerostris extrusa]|uniref:Uncharacterized protein n=1 Tax=Caerostris extrusa TaxID=172846 RepID=A0AAV4V0X5_CAEEX|nr:hypothetical protein CEXT_407151 [Caerostris extrusa]